MLRSMRRANDAWLLAAGMLGLLYFIYRAALVRFYFFDGDHAIQIMMAKHFAWRSQDFYYWGQNRLGSLIPVLLIVPLKWLSLPPLHTAVACATGFYLAVVALLIYHAQSRAERVAALVAAFLVPIGAYKFLLYTGHPYGPSMALSLAAFTLLFAGRASRGRMLGVGALLSVACWVSEATLAAVVPLLWLAFQRRERLSIRRTHWLWLGAGLAWLVPFVFYWRRQIGFDGHDADYVKPADLEMLQAGLLKFLPQFSDMLNSMRPRASAMAAGVACVLVLSNLCVLFTPASWLHEGRDRPRAPILNFLALHNALYFLVVLFSRHSYFGEGLIQRFWVPVIVYSLYLALVFAVRVVQMSECRAVFKTVSTVVGLSVILSMSALSSMSWPTLQTFKTMREHRDDVKSALARGATHVTADYWRALPLNVLSGFRILAVPRDFSRTGHFRAEFSREARDSDPGAYLDF